MPVWLCWRPWPPLRPRYAVRIATRRGGLAWVLAYLLGFCCYTVLQGSGGPVVETLGRCCHVELESTEPLKLRVCNGTSGGDRGDELGMV